MDTWDAIRARRNVRAFTEQDVAPGDLDRILEAAWRTPSSSNQQRWAFVAVTDRAKLVELAEVWRGAAFVGKAAAVIALVAPLEDEQRARESGQYHLRQATKSIMLA